MYYAFCWNGGVALTYINIKTFLFTTVYDVI